MAVTADARQSGAMTSGATSISWTMTISALLSNSIIIVCATTGAVTAVQVSGVNWDDTGTPQALTNKGRIVDANNSCYAEIWYGLSPSSGTKTIKVSTGTSCEITGESSSYYNVNQSIPFNAASPQTTTGTA
jgi:hypothetical protein